MVQAASLGLECVTSQWLLARRIISPINAYWWHAHAFMGQHDVCVCLFRKVEHASSIG
ncbi:hypothetical protein OK016_22255 [Vibrio chagasii]|nr:hypothetical protein [Vibrio chagasii]